MGAAPGVGEVVGPAEVVENHLQPGEAACKIRNLSDLARPRLDRGDQFLVGQESEGVGQSAVRIGGCGRRARLDRARRRLGLYSAATARTGGTLPRAKRA